MVISVKYEEPIVDGTVADVSTWNEETEESTVIGSMIFSEDLNQWNDTEFPGDVADQDPLVCADKMIKFRKDKKVTYPGRDDVFYP